MIPQITSTPAEFSCALKRAETIVASWPKWKRNVPAIVEKLKTLTAMWAGRKGK